jgi:quercetin dioxygenase-like cupin family protein
MLTGRSPYDGAGNETGGTMGHRIYARNADTDAVVVGAIEARPTGGTARLKHLLQGDRALLLEITFERGVTVPPHTHDHESYCYCVRGSVRSTVDGVDHVLGPGDAVFHPAGVVHETEALADSVWVEVKTPPVRTW